MTADHSNDPCQWCGQALQKRRTNQRYHDRCRQSAYRVHINIAQRLKVLSERLGVTRHELRVRLQERGCEVCGTRSFTGRGPARIIPFPSYRVVLDRYLVCPSCSKALNGAALDCPPIVIRWILSRFGTRSTDSLEQPVVDRSSNSPKSSVIP